MDDGDGISPPKRRFLQKPHGVTSQKTAFFIPRSLFRNIGGTVSRLFEKSAHVGKGRTDLLADWGGLIQYPELSSHQKGARLCRVKEVVTILPED
jgi:hypothetical protein